MPPRIVSLNPCLDGILIAVADPAQILALSHYARDPFRSDIAAAAQFFPITYETAEEVVALRPDLVIESAHSSPATRAALARLGIAAVLLQVPKSVAGNLAQIREVARLAGHPERGELLVSRIEAALAAAAPPPGAQPLPALVFQANGFAAPTGTLVDEMLTRTGFTNVAARYGLTKWGNVPLERLIADPPDVLLSDDPGPGAQGWGERVAHHPALAGIAGQMKRGTFPRRLLDCGGPVLIDAAAQLAAARRAIVGDPR